MRCATAFRLAVGVTTNGMVRPVLPPHHEAAKPKEVAMAQCNTPRAAAVYGIDIGKNIFHVVGLGGDGAVIQKVRFRRDTLLQFFERAAPAIVGMESSACHGQIETATECRYRWLRVPATISTCETPVLVAGVFVLSEIAKIPVRSPRTSIFSSPGLTICAQRQSIGKRCALANGRRPVVRFHRLESCPLVRRHQSNRAIVTAVNLCYPGRGQCRCPSSRKN